MIILLGKRELVVLLFFGLYIVKLGFTGVYIILLILLKTIDCGYSLELPLRGSSNEYPQSMI